METRAKLAKEQYAFSKDSETHLLIELSAPRVEINEKRTPICLVPVLDVSGSMAGRKIDYVRKACRKLMDHLAPGDYAGVVAFDSDIYEVAPIREITQDQKENIKTKISKLKAGSCTNLSGGLAKALEWVNAMDLPSNTIMRVILFTDGHANTGVVGRQLLEFSMELRQRATISAFGFGSGCDQELLADISAKNDGNYAFINSADDAMYAFGQELGGLMTTYGQDIAVTIKPDKNNQVLEILNDEDVVDDNGNIVVKLRDILGEEKKWIVAKVKLNEVSKPFPRKLASFNVMVEFTDRDGKKQKIEEFPIKVKFCKPCDESINEDPEVVKQRDRLLAAKAQEKAEQYARVGNYQLASETMTMCFNNITDAETRGVVDSLTTSYNSAHSYTSDKGMTNSVRHLLGNKRLSSTRDRKVKKLAKSAGAQESAVVGSFVNSFVNDDKSWDTANGEYIEQTTTSDGTHVDQTTNGKSKKRSDYDW